MSLDEFRVVAEEMAMLQERPNQFNKALSTASTTSNSDVGFLVNLYNTVSGLKINSFNKELEDDKAELQAKIIFDLELLANLHTPSNIPIYALDFRKVSLKIELLEIEMKELLWTKGKRNSSNLEIINKIEQINDFLQRIYLSGLIDSSRKNFLIHRYRLTELMLRSLSEMHEDARPQGLLVKIFETSRLGETGNNKRLLVQGKSMTKLLRKMLFELEPLDVLLLSKGTLESELLALHKRNLIREKYYSLVSSTTAKVPTSDGVNLRNTNDYRITFFVGSDNTYQLVQNSDGVVLLSHSSTVLKQSVWHAVTCLSDAKASLSGRKADNNRPEKHLKHLYRNLIEPLSMDRNSRLNIRTDGFLNELPFELLMDKDDEYLFEFLTIAIAESPTEELLSVRQSITFSEGKFDTPLFQLEEASNEITFLRTEMKAKDNQFNFDKSEEEHIYHLATHQRMNAIMEPVMLINEDDLLNRKSLYEFNTVPKVMVLSNCESLAGRVVSGEGNQSFARKAWEIGSDAIIGNLWSVEDQASSQIMMMYYSGLKSGLDSRESLNFSRAYYLSHADEFHENPFFWASYIHYGKNFYLSVKSKGRAKLFGFLILTLGVFLLFLSNSRIWIHY